MKENIEFSLNTAVEAEIAAHLLYCESSFVPRLSGRVDINGYAHKIANSAARFEAWADSLMIGLVAIYCNDSDRKVAYITSVSVLPRWQGRGVARQLIEQSIAHIRDIGFENIELEVDNNNVAALALYKSIGFMKYGVSGRTATMYLVIGRGV